MFSIKALNNLPLLAPNDVAAATFKKCLAAVNCITANYANCVFGLWLLKKRGDEDALRVVISTSLKPNSVEYTLMEGNISRCLGGAFFYDLSTDVIGFDTNESAVEDIRSEIKKGNINALYTVTDKEA